MRIRIEIDEKTMRDLINGYLKSVLGNVSFSENDVKILVKSKQNYKSEWESAAFKAELEVYNFELEDKT
jgi:hypothetical protein